MRIVRVFFGLKWWEILFFVRKGEEYIKKAPVRYIG